MGSVTLLLAAWLCGCPCLFDRDQVADEVAARPELRDAIFGVYPIRSPEYYRARILEIEQVGALTPSLTDDLAVAWLQLGDTNQAIGLLQEKEQRWPGLFTTAANLSRAYAMAGKMVDAIAQAETAVSRAEAGQAAGQQFVLAALRQVKLAADDRNAAQRTTLLGYDVAARLGEDFRLKTPLTPDEGWRNSVDQRLGISPDLEGYLIDLVRLSGPEQAEAVFVLAELCAAHGDRYLAWHAYQRALDLRHPRSVDLPYYQDQLSRVVAPDARSDFTELHHYHLRRKAVAWQKDWQRREAEVLADGGDPREPSIWQSFLEEHPKP